MKKESSKLRRSRSGEHGGHLSGGKRKTARPISTRCPMVVQLRSQVRRGPQGLAQNRKLIRAIVAKQAESFRVKLIAVRISGDQLFMTIQVPSRPAFQQFVKSCAGLIARAIMRAERGAPKNTRYWAGIPYSCILET